MHREPGPHDLDDRRVVDEDVDDRSRIRAVTVHSDAECLDAAQDEPAVEWPGDGSHGVLVEPQLLHKRGIGGDERAADDVTVTAEVLRRAVNDDVGAQCDRLLQVGRGEGAVDDEQRARRMRHPGQRGDVGDVE